MCLSLLEKVKCATIKCLHRELTQPRTLAIIRDKLCHKVEDNTASAKALKLEKAGVHLLGFKSQLCHPYF